MALKSEPFPDTVRLVNWSLSGGILAVSGGDNKVTIWREGLIERRMMGGRSSSRIKLFVVQTGMYIKS